MSSKVLVSYTQTCFVCKGSGVRDVEGSRAESPPPIKVGWDPAADGSPRCCFFLKVSRVDAQCQESLNILKVFLGLHRDE
jgi:hypothetical protein